MRLRWRHCQPHISSPHWSVCNECVHRLQVQSVLYSDGIVLILGENGQPLRRWFQEIQNRVDSAGLSQDDTLRALRLKLVGT